jgi:RNA polymerase sigma-70 factor, ECF subfamily
MTRQEVSDYISNSYPYIGKIVSNYVRGSGIKDSTIIDDLVQETMLRLWRVSADKELFPDTLNGYASTLARNIFLNYYNKRKRNSSSSLRTDMGIHDKKCDDPSDKLVLEEKVAMHTRAISVLHGALERLTPEENKLLRDHYIHEIPIKEIGKEYGLNKGIIKMRLHRARGIVKRYNPNPLVA